MKPTIKSHSLDNDKNFQHIFSIFYNIFEGALNLEEIQSKLTAITSDERIDLMLNGMSSKKLSQFARSNLEREKLRYDIDVMLLKANPKDV